MPFSLNKVKQPGETALCNARVRKIIIGMTFNERLCPRSEVNLRFSGVINECIKIGSNCAYKSQWISTNTDLKIRQLGTGNEQCLPVGHRSQLHPMEFKFILMNIAPGLL